jgi:(4S)-4-hydroxy-5-phosphonooxypentane-2,3-dione isomerase
MITRIVKMIFREEEIPVFLEIFNDSCSLIRNAEGCKSLRLLQSETDRRIMFTISEWEDKEFLEKYRASDLFKSTWAKTKIMFAEKPEAWSTTQPA